MFICISNDKEMDSSMYDICIDISKLKNPQLINNWWISLYGVVDSNSISLNKQDLQRNYKKEVNQITSNDTASNVTWETATGEIIEFIGIGNHLEKEI